MTFPFVRRGALVLAAALIWRRAAPWRRRRSPRRAPSGPAAPGAGRPARPRQPQGPVKLELTPIAAPWTKVCGKDPESGKEVCYTTREFGQVRRSAADAGDRGLPDRPARTAASRGFLLPLGLLLRPGFRLMIDKGEPIDGKFAICFPTAASPKPT